MKRRRFERPTDHYNEHITSIDEQICALFKQRKEISKNNPGFPPLETITSWSETYDLYEDLLIHVFETLRNDEYLRPRVEPNGFRKHLPILKSVELDDHIYTITFIRQYENASVVHFHIDWEEETDDEMILSRHLRNRHFWDLQIGEHYDCRHDGGGGSTGHYTHLCHRLCRKSLQVFP
ncbi:hypothetical protein [Metabacillus idriensis]|uniref:hypothetical protein n=1 Tax=Metabacillus idriensis TaxID=324768 RepID=UPI0029672733|nr:hypothetical protein [Metabacillus idriensis]